MIVEFEGDKTKEGSFEVIPAGDYYLICDDVQDSDKNGQTLVSKNGNPMCVLEMVVKEGEHEGRRILHYLTFLPKDAKGHGMTLHALHAFGLPYDGAVEIDTDSFKGRTVKAKIGIQEATSEYRAKNVIKDFYVLEHESDKVPPQVKQVFPEARPIEQPAKPVEVAKPKPKLPWGKK